MQNSFFVVNTASPISVTPTFIAISSDRRIFCSNDTAAENNACSPHQISLVGPGAEVEDVDFDEIDFVKKRFLIEFKCRHIYPIITGPCNGRVG